MFRSSFLIYFSHHRKAIYGWKSIMYFLLKFGQRRGLLNQKWIYFYPEKSVKGNVSDLKTFKTLGILTNHF